VSGDALTNNFTPSSINHVRRQCTYAAHILARSAELFISIDYRNFAPDCSEDSV
jgi:hypothetical protein